MNREANETLELALEPRVMFDAAAVATAAAVANDVLAADALGAAGAANGDVSTSGTGAAITVDHAGHAADTDIFRDVSVARDDLGTVTLSVTGAGKGSSLTLNGQSVSLTHGTTVELAGNGFDGLLVKVTESGSKATVSIDVAGQSGASVATMLDQMSIDINGETQTESAVSVSIDSVADMNGSASDVGITSTLTVDSRYNHAPQIAASDDLSIADQIYPSGITEAESLVSSSDGSVTFAMDSAGKVSVFQTVNGKLTETAHFDAASIEGFGTIAGIAAGGDGSHVVVTDTDKVYVLNYSSDAHTLTYSGQSAETGGNYQTLHIAASSDGRSVYVNNGDPAIRVFSIGDDGSITEKQTLAVDQSFDQIAAAGDYVIATSQFWISPILCFYQRGEDGTLTFLGQTDLTGTGTDPWQVWDAKGGMNITADGSRVFFFDNVGGHMMTFVKGADGSYTAGVTTPLTGAVSYAVNDSGTELCVLTDSGTLIRYTVDASGGLAEAGRTEGLTGAKTVSIADDGTVNVAGTRAYRLTAEKIGTWGSDIAFSTGLTISDQELDRGNDYGGASFTVKSSNPAGVFSFSASGYEYRDGGIYSGDTKVASVSLSDGTLSVSFESGCGKDTANAVLKGWNYRMDSGSTGSVTLTVTVNDGERVSDAEVIPIVLQTNQAPTVSVSGDAAHTYTTAGDSTPIFGEVAVTAGEAGQKITAFTVTVTNASAAGSLEYLTLDGTKIALNADSSGSTGSGYAYIYEVGKDGTGSLRMTFGAGIDVASAGKALQSIAYGNTSVAGETAEGLSGTHVFTIDSVTDNGGSANGGTDTAHPGTAVTVTVDMNSAPVIDLNGGTGSDAFESGKVLDGTGESYTNVVEVSPDGETVIAAGSSGDYNAGSGESTLYVYRRDPETGSMTLLQTFRQSDATDGLTRVSGAAYSADGKYVWVAGAGTDGGAFSLILFSRADDGKLTYVGKAATQGEAGAAGLDHWVNQITVSSDGKTLYTVNGKNALGAGQSGSSVSVFRIGDGGSLTFIQNITENINTPTDAVVSPDGLTVYVASRSAVTSGSKAVISVFSRSSEDGSLNYTGAIDLGTTKGTVDLAMSSDGTRIYSLNTDLTLTVLTKTADGGTADFTVAQSIKVAGNSAIPGSVELSPDGKTLYVGGYMVNGPAIYSVADDGQVTNTGTNANNPSEYRWSTTVAVSPDGTSVFWGGTHVWQGIGYANALGLCFDSGSGAHIGQRLLITDADDAASGSYAGMTVTFSRSGGANTADVFTFKTSADVTLSGSSILYQGKEVGTLTNDAGVLTIKFSGDAVTADAARAVLREVVYEKPDSENLVRLTVTANDGEKETSLEFGVKEGGMGIQGEEGDAKPYNPGTDAAALPNSEISLSAGTSPANIRTVITASDSQAVFGLQESSGYAWSDGKIYRGTVSAGTEIGTYSQTGGRLTLTYTEEATVDDMNGVLQSLTFRTETGSGTVTLSAALTSDTGDTLAETESAAVFYINQAPEWTAESGYGWEVFPGDTVQFAVPADLFKDPEGKALTYSVTGLPDGMTFDPDTMTVSGTAPTGEASITVTVTAADADGRSASKEITLQLSNTANRAPEADTDSSLLKQTTVAGKGFDQDLSSVFKDPNGDPVTFKATGLPDRVTVSETGVLSGVPTVSGTFSAVITATDSHGLAASATVTLTIENTPPEPISGIVFPAPAAGKETAVDLHQFFKDKEGNPIHFAADGLPKGITLGDDGVIRGVPEESGTFAIRVTAADTFGAETTETFTVTIANSAPVFNSAYEGFVIDAGESRIAIPRGIPLPQDLFTDDFGVTGWKITGVSKDGAAVAGGLSAIGLELDSDTGILTGRPGAAGDYQVTVEASDASGLTASHVITLHIGANQPPVVTDGVKPPVFVLNSTERASASLADWIRDPAGEPLTYTLTGDLPKGLSWNPDTQTLSGIAREGGNYRLTLSASDGSNDPVSVEFTLAIRDNAAPRASELFPGERFVVGGNYSISLDGFISDPDGDAMTYTVEGLPDGLSFDSETGMIYGSPVETGKSDVTITATDQYGLKSTFEAELNVTENAAPRETQSVAFGNAGGKFAANLYQMFSDPDGDALKITLTDPSAIPAGFTFDAAAGVISGSSDAETSFDLTLQVTDRYGASVTKTVSVLIRVNHVSSADAAVWMPPEGRGLELLRDQAVTEVYDSVRLAPAVLATDGPAMRPVFGVTSPVTPAASIPAPGDGILAASSLPTAGDLLTETLAADDLSTAAGLQKVFERTVEAGDKARELRDAAMEARVESASDQNGVPLTAPHRETPAAPDQAADAYQAASVESAAAETVPQAITDAGLPGSVNPEVSTSGAAELLTAAEAPQPDLAAGKVLERRALYRESEFTVKTEA